METQTVRIDMDTRRAEQDLGRIEARADAFIAGLENIVVSVMPQLDDSEFDALVQQIEGFDPTVDVALSVDQTPIDELDASVQGLDTNLVYDVEVDGAQLDAVAEQAAALDAQSIDVDVSAPGTEQTIANFDELGLSTDALIGKFTTGLPGGIGKTLASLGALGVGVAIVVAALAGLFEAGQRVQDAQNDIQIATGATGEALADLGESALAIIDEVPSSLDNAATAVGTLNTFLGLTGAELERLAGGILNASRLLKEDAAANTQNFAQVLNLFGIEADKGVEKLDLLFAATQKYGVGLGELLGTLESSGNIFQAVGLDLEQSTILIGQFNLAGLGASEATAALTQLIARADDTGKTFNETLLDLQDRIKGATTDQEAFNVGIEAFGTRSGVAFSRAIRAGIIDLENLSGALGDTSGLVAQTAADTETVGTSLRKAGNDLLAAVAPIGNELVEATTKFLVVLTNLFDFLTESGAIDLFLDGLRLISTVLDILSGDFLAFGDLVIDVFDFLLGPLNELIGLIPGLGDPIEGVRGEWEKLRDSLEDPIVPQVRTDGVVDRFSAMERGAGAALRATRAAAEEAGRVEGLREQFGGLADVLAEGEVSAEAFVAELSGPLRSAVESVLGGQFFTQGAEARVRIALDQDGLAAELEAAGITVDQFLTEVQALTNERTVGLAESFSGALGGELDRIANQLDLKFNIDTNNGINDVQDAINQIDAIVTQFEDRDRAADSPLLEGLDEVQRRVASGEFDALIDDINAAEGGTDRAILERLEASLVAAKEKQAAAAQAAAAEYREAFADALENGEKVDPIQALIDSARITPDQFLEIADQYQTALDTALNDRRAIEARTGVAFEGGEEQAQAMVDGYTAALERLAGDVEAGVVGLPTSEAALDGMVEAGATSAAALLEGQLDYYVVNGRLLTAKQVEILESNTAQASFGSAGATSAGAFTQGFVDAINANSQVFQRSIEDAIQGAGFGATPFATGGTIRRPTFAMMGEAGTETVVPEYASISRIRALLGETSILRRLEAEFSAQQRQSFEHFNAQAAEAGRAPAGSTVHGGTYVDHSRTELRIVDGGQSLASKQLTARQAIAELRRDRERRRRRAYAGATAWGG